MAFAYANNTHITQSSFTHIEGDFTSYTAGGNMSIHEKEKGLQALLQVASPGAAYDSQERYPPPKCHPGTRQEILKDLGRWIANTVQAKAGSILWLHGPAGAGKSAIAQTISETCAERGQLAASFFFSRGRAGRDSIIFLFTTLALQMAMSARDLRKKIEEAVQNNPTIIHKDASRQLQVLIVEPFLSRTRIPEETAPPSVIVIDGLDECGSNSEQIQILSRIVDLIHINDISLHFLVVSRPEPHIRHIFKKPIMDSINFRVVSLLGTHEAYHDVHLFLKDGFENIVNSETHLDVMRFVQKPWPSSNVIDAIVEKSGGYFIYASTVLRFIDEEYYSPIDRLNELMNASSGRSSGAFKELDKLYTQILSTCPNRGRILGCHFVPSDTTKKINLVGTIETILNLRQGEVCLTLRGLHSLLDVQSAQIYDKAYTVIGTDMRIRSFHASLEDFLLDPGRSGSFYVNPDDCHADISRGLWHLFTNWSAKNGDNLEELTKNMIASFPYHFFRSGDKRKLFEDLATANSATWVPFIHASKKWEVKEKLDICYILCAVSGELDHLVQPPKAIIQQLTMIIDMVFHEHLSPRSWNDIEFIQGISVLLDKHTALRDDMLSTAKLVQLDIFYQSYWSDICTYINSLSCYSRQPPNGELTRCIDSATQFSQFMNNPERSRELFCRSETRHARLALFCINGLAVKLDPSYVLDRRSYELVYARKFWAEHLSRAPPGDKSLLRLLQTFDERIIFGEAWFLTVFGFNLSWKPLSSATHQQVQASIVFNRFFPAQKLPESLELSRKQLDVFRELDTANAKLVVDWLKAIPSPPSDLILRWETYCGVPMTVQHQTIFESSTQSSGQKRCWRVIWNIIDPISCLLTQLLIHLLTCLLNEYLTAS